MSINFTKLYDLFVIVLSFQNTIWDEEFTDRRIIDNEGNFLISNKDEHIIYSE